MLDSAEEVCGESEFKWGWNDVRLGTRILLAQYGSKKSHANILERQLDGIMKYDLKEICQVPEHATSLANLFVMATQLLRILKFLTFLEKYDLLCRSLTNQWSIYIRFRHSA